MFRNRHVLMEEAGAETSNPGEEAPPSAADLSDSNWRSSLPPELADLPSLQDIPDVATLAKNYDNTKAMVGNSIRLPTDEAGQEDINKVVEKVLGNERLGLMKKPDVENPELMAEVYQALGRPEDASGYTVPEDINGELFGSLSETALELGLSKRQYEGMAAALGKQQMDDYTRHEEQKAQGIAQLKGELGPAYDQRLDRATKTAEALKAPQALIDALKDGSANAEAIRFMDNIATQLGVEGSQFANQIGPVTESTVADIQQRINERTKRMMSERLSPAEHQELIKRNVADQEKLLAYRK